MDGHRLVIRSKQQTSRPPSAGFEPGAERVPPPTLRVKGSTLYGLGVRYYSSCCRALAWFGLKYDIKSTTQYNVYLH